MERIFKHKESGEIAYFKDGLFKRGNVVIDLAVLPSGEYWEEVNSKSENTFPQANIIDTWLEKNGDPTKAKLIAEQVEKEAEQLELENAANEYASLMKNEDGTSDIDFIEGANWQAKRMYSEEEVRKAIDYGAELGLNDDIGNSFQWRDKQNKWFENNKK